MSTYSEKLTDPRWQAKRIEVLDRDGHACRDCGVSEANQDRRPTLDIHHCAYVGEPWDAPNDVLLTVCRECHGIRQELEDKARINLGRIMAGQRDCHLYEFTKHLENGVSYAIPALFDRAT